MEIIKNDSRSSLCPLCKSNLILFIGTIKPDIHTYYSSTIVKLSKISELWQCKNCESSFVQNTVSVSDSVRLYSEGFSEKMWTNLTFEESRTKTTIATIEKFLLPGTKILDVGCGSGNFLDFAKAKGCTTSGVEYSRSSLRLIIENGHAAFSSLDKVYDTFDIITAFDVIEHLYNVPEFIEVCKAKLKPNGYIILLSGDISCLQSKISKSRWWYVKYPEHIVFPSIKYYNNYTGLLLLGWTKIYHSPNFKFGIIKATIKTLLKMISKNIYDGHPPLFPDHFLIILKNEMY